MALVRLVAVFIEPGLCRCPVAGVRTIALFGLGMPMCLSACSPEPQSWETHRLEKVNCEEAEQRAEILEFAIVEIASLRSILLTKASRNCKEAGMIAEIGISRMSHS